MECHTPWARFGARQVGFGTLRGPCSPERQLKLEPAFLFTDLSAKVDFFYYYTSHFLLTNVDLLCIQGSVHSDLGGDESEE